MAKKWSNLNLPGALHYVTANVVNRLPVFTNPACCQAFIDILANLNQKWPSKLIAYVLMPDHLHLNFQSVRWANQGIHWRAEEPCCQPPD